MGAGEIIAARAIVAAGLPALAPVTREHFAKCLRVLLAALPKRASDEVSGELLVAAYRRKLGNMPADQVNYLADRVLEQCEWFPTIAECLRIASGWRRDDEAIRAYQRAETKLFWDRQKRFDATMKRLASAEIMPEQIPLLPAGWIDAAAQHGYIFREGDEWIYRDEWLRRQGLPREEPNAQTVPSDDVPA